MLRPLAGMLLLSSPAWIACTWVGSPVPVSGEVPALAGEWMGDYWSAESGRRGTIVFRLAAGSDTARGEVIMYEGSIHPPMPTDPGSRHTTDRPAVALSISFVRVSAGVVTGRLDPYRDPECGCLLTTEFIGNLKADTLAGTFTSYHHEMAKTVRGEWRAVQSARKPGT